MNHRFSLKFDEMQENKTLASDQDNTRYAAAGHVRNVCFQGLDGKSVFLNYSYLVSGEFDPAQSVITLSFTTHRVIIRGIRLQGLYDALMNQIARIIACIEDRYNEVEDRQATIVNSIEVQAI